MSIGISELPLALPGAEAASRNVIRGRYQDSSAKTLVTASGILTGL